MDKGTAEILNSETKRTKGIDARNSNIEAAKAVSNIIKTTLGPTGMDKMLIDSFGNTIITNDGVKILKEIEVEHPGAKMLIEVAKTQEINVGDGTTSAVILAGELLGRAQELLNKKIHPTQIIKLFQIASKESLKILDNNALKIKTNNLKTLMDICQTAITGKIGDISKNKLSKLICDIAVKVKTKNSIPKNRIKIIKAVGGNIEDSSIFEGIILDKELSNSNMPRKLINPKVLLIDFPLEVRELDSEAKININSVNEYEDFINSEKEYLKSLVYKIKMIGANVVICQKRIDDNVSYYLAKENIMAISRTKKSDLEKLSFIFDKKIISSYDDLLEENLGKTNLVEVRKILDENYIFIESGKNKNAITLFLKSSTVHILDELERAIEDALGDLNVLMKSRKIVAGGGAIEVEIYNSLIKFSKNFSDWEQLIIVAFAKSFLIIPKILLNNTGLNERSNIKKLVLNHLNKLKYSGVNTFEGIINDTLKIGIIEPIDIKIQVIKSATELSSMILKVDDIIAAKKIE